MNKDLINLSVSESIGSIDYCKTGDNIERLMKLRGISAYRLSDLTGNTPQAVGKWKDGSSIPTVQNVVKLIVIFGCAFEDIIAFR